MATDDFNPKNALQITRMIHLSQVAGSLAYLMLVFYTADENFIFYFDISDPLFFSLFILCFGGIPAGYFLSRKSFSKINTDDLLKNKYPVYQNSLVIKSATCAIVALFASVCLQLTYNLLSIIFFFIALIIMTVYYPTPEKVGREIKLSQAEIELFY